MQHMQKRNCVIDIMRLVISVIIVFIHCPFPGAVGRYIIILGRVGVPFFLVLSGWFSYHPDQDTVIARTKKKMVDTVRLLCIFFAAYFLMNTITSFLLKRDAFAWVQSYCNLDTLVNLVLYNRAWFLGSTGYYPFLLLYVYIIFSFLVKTNTIRKAYYLIPVLLLYNVVCGEFTDIPWYHYGNFLFTGLPFFLLGHWLRANKTVLDKLSPIWLWLFLAGTISSFVEAHCFKSAYCHFGSILMAVSLFTACISSKLVWRQDLVSCFQRCSVYIFIVHCGLRDILKAFMQVTGLSCSPYVFPLLVLLASVLVSVVWDRIAVRMQKA